MTFFTAGRYIPANLQSVGRRATTSRRQLANLRIWISLYFPSTLEATDPAEFAQQIHATSRSAMSLAVLRCACELAGVEFIDENGGGPGVRLRKGSQKKR